MNEIKNCFVALNDDNDKYRYSSINKPSNTVCFVFHLQIGNELTVRLSENATSD